MKKLIKFKALMALAPALLFTSCEKAQTPEPALKAVGIANAASAPVPCMSEGYGIDANGVGAYQLPTPRTIDMGNLLTGLNRSLSMVQVKYIITPSGKESSVWQGVDNSTAPSSKITFPSTAWSECGKGYESKCVRYADGRVTLSLTTDSNVLPFEN